MKKTALVAAALTAFGCTTTGTTLAGAPDVTARCFESEEVIAPTFAVLGCKLENRGSTAQTVAIEHVRLGEVRGEARIATADEAKGLWAKHHEAVAASREARGDAVVPSAVIVGSMAKDGRGVVAAAVVGAALAVMAVTGDENAPPAEKPQKQAPSASDGVNLTVPARGSTSTEIPLVTTLGATVRKVDLCFRAPAQGCIEVPVERSAARARLRPKPQ